MTCWPFPNTASLSTLRHTSLSKNPKIVTVGWVHNHPGAVKTPLPPTDNGAGVKGGGMKVQESVKVKLCRSNDSPVTNSSRSCAEHQQWWLTWHQSANIPSDQFTMTGKRRRKKKTHHSFFFQLSAADIVLTCQEYFNFVVL